MRKFGCDLVSQHVSVGDRCGHFPYPGAEVDYLCKSMSASDLEAARKGIWLNHGLYWFHN